MDTDVVRGLDLAHAAVEHDPGNGPLHDTLAWALFANGLHDEALAESARALEEKIVERPSDVDLAMVFGTGFAPFRGGPLRYTDSVGVGKIVDGLKALREPRYVPCELLERLASSGQSLYGLQAAADESRSVASVESAGT